MAEGLLVYLMALGNNSGQGIQATPINSTVTGTTTSGTTETFDAVLGYYQFNAIIGRRYIAMLNNCNGSASVVADLYSLRIRDSGSAANPTAASTAVASSQWYCSAVGGPGQDSVSLQGTFTAASNGTHTLGISATRIAGTGTFNFVSSFARELLVIDLGVF